jgi:hypothetical protein
MLGILFVLAPLAGLALGWRARRSNFAAEWHRTVLSHFFLTWVVAIAALAVSLSRAIFLERWPTIVDSVCLFAVFVIFANLFVQTAAFTDRRKQTAESTDRR